MGKFEMLCELLPAEVNWGDPITPQMVEEMVLAEREACAKVCENFDFNQRHEIPPPRTLPRFCAAAIRMRSNVMCTPDGV